MERKDDLPIYVQGTKVGIYFQIFTPCALSRGKIHHNRFYLQRQFKFQSVHPQTQSPPAEYVYATYEYHF